MSFLGINDIKNYFYIRKQIAEMKKEPTWDALVLRSQGAKIYTVRTLPNEYFGEDSEILKERVREVFEPVFKWLNNWNLQDVMIPDFPERIPDSNSYLLILRPNPKVWTTNYKLAWISILALLSLALFIIL